MQTHHTDVLPHTPEEGLDVIDRGGVDEFTVVEDETYPEVVHEDGEAGHDSEDAPWSTKLEPGAGELAVKVQDAGTYSVCL